MNTTPEAPSERDEIEMLLPWYASGRLDPADVNRVEAYLSEHPEMQEYLDLVRKEQNETHYLNTSSAAKPATSADRFMSDVVGVSSGRASNPVSWLLDFFGAPGTSGLRWAGAAAAAVILVQAAAIVMLALPQTENRYQQASGELRASSDGTFALVRFSGDADMSGIAKLLIDRDMKITEGPLAGGLFRIRIGDSGMSEEDRKSRIKALSERKDLIVFVTAAR